MSKKCMICGEGAVYKIKNGNEHYCPECAKEHFNDISFLQKVEEKAQQLKKVIKGRMNGSSEDAEEH